MNLFRRIRDWGITALLIALPLFALRANLRDPSRAGIVDRWLLSLSAPTQWLGIKLASGVSSALEEYVYLVDVQRENERLSYENSRLAQRMGQVEELERENRRLRSLLTLRDTFGGDVLSARVIAKEFSPLFRVTRVRLDRGTDDKVKDGLAVVTPEGLVGQLIRSEGRYADVMLTVDEASAVDVVVSRTGSRGVLRGTGAADQYVCRIQYLLRADEIRVGDAVYTSGLGKRFPANLKVGTISKVERREFGLYQLAEVTPSVNFSRLEEVLVLTAGSRGDGPTAAGLGDVAEER